MTVERLLMWLTGLSLVVIVLSLAYLALLGAQ
jgi:hypothetical protein